VTEAYDGREVVGMDLHRRRSVLVRMTADGRKLETARITNSPAELRRQIARAGKHPRVVLEATYGWYWAADTLATAGAEVHLANPLGVKGFAYRRVKNDERDAADLADLLRMGRLPEAWVAPHEVRELRELTRYRHKLVRIRTSCKDQVHAILAKLGIPVTCTGIFGVWGSTWLDELALPQPYAGRWSRCARSARCWPARSPCWKPRSPACSRSVRAAGRCAPGPASARCSAR
jgi:transposase